MRLDVYFTPTERKPTDTVGRLVVIVDVLRASTTVATALGNGAKTVIPMHYDTFPPIETDAGAFKAEVESKTSSRVVLLEAGETHSV